MGTKIDQTSLNAICPYFTMFPLGFPNEVLGNVKNDAQWVIDPFCGRGTTNYAARLNGINTIGIDSNPVAVAITEAKLVATIPEQVIEEAKAIIYSAPEPEDIPSGEFWKLAYHKDVLLTVCRIREELLRDCSTPARKALRGVMLGGLHGHVLKTTASYFSNQCQRTYSPKPDYAIRYWKTHKLDKPPLVDVMQVISKRAKRAYSVQLDAVENVVIHGDSREPSVFVEHLNNLTVDWIITSPPYYGMKSYLPDQWLRLWFVGNSPEVNYDKSTQLKHSGHEVFAEELGSVWSNLRMVSTNRTQMVIRFGGLPSVKSDPVPLLEKSLEGTGWQINRIASAGLPTDGNRQAYQQAKKQNPPIEEFDVWASLM